MDLTDLEAVLVGRRTDPPPGSYSATLVSDPEQASRKISEEAFEVGLELNRPTIDPDRVAEEAADLVFHLLAGLVAVDVSWQQVMDALAARRKATP